MRVLTANAGSSSVKLRLIGGHDELLAERDVDTDPLQAEAQVEDFAESLGPLDAVGHRVVHGGALREPILIGDDEVRELSAAPDLAPLHNAAAVRLMTTLRRACPDVPHVACFDTSFHRSLPDEAALYALPLAWIERFGLRRYGFHGLSHAYASRRAAELAGLAADELRIVTCHLGAGASLAAVAGGRSVDTTMGFTPNDGLVMATRSGSLDPGLMIWLLEEDKLSAAELGTALERQSGLRGLSGGTGDMRELLAAVERGEDRAATAFAVYTHRLRGSIAAMAAAMGGLDALAFTGGVGERSPEVRTAACERLGFVGLALDPALNADAVGADTDVSAEDAAVRTRVVQAREDLEIAAQVRNRLAGSRETTDHQAAASADAAPATGDDDRSTAHSRRLRGQE